MAGNHDERTALLAAFPQTPSQGGFVHYACEFPGLRLVVLDTVEAGRHGGAFCEERAEWLRAQLSAQPLTPTVIAMHHPPFASGIAWLDAGADEAWIGRFAKAIAGQPQVKAILAGHLHRTIHTAWRGIAMTVCMSTAPAVALDLDPVDPDRPDGRAMITDEAPGYALHRWDGERLVSHFEAVGEARVLAHYDAAFQPIVKLIREEQRSG
jgi:3',5'-cyclic AMP phosphodiesterase CpdA